MRRTMKHNATRVVYNDFSGGVNVMSEGDLIAPNEMQFCQNLWFLGYQRALVPRGGLSAPLFSLPSAIRGAFYDVDSNTLLVFLVDRSVYSVAGDMAKPKRLGELTGESRPSCAKFQDRIWIASGGRLQAYDFSGEGSLKTVDAAPVCDMVFQRSARLCTSLSGSDRLTLSAVGDGFTWAVDDNDKSKGAWLDVGYGDSGDIIAVVPLATDLLIFKNNGMIYQLVGDQAIDTWAVYRVATETDAVGHGCAVAVGNDAVFVSRQGMKTMHTTMDYGNIAQGDIGEKWNALVVKSLYEPEMFHLRRRKLLLICPTSHKESLIAYNYAVGAATTLSFPVPVTAVVERPDGLLVLSRREAYRMEETNLTDDGATVDYRLRVRDIVSGDEIIVRGVDSSMAAEQAGEAVVEVDTMRLSMPVNARRKVRTNHTSARIVTTVSSQTPFQIKHLALEVADL